MAQAKASRQSIKPRVREEAAVQRDALDALSFSSTPTQAEVEALRDAVSDILEDILVNPSS